MKLFLTQALSSPVVDGSRSMPSSRGCSRRSPSDFGNRRVSGLEGDRIPIRDESFDGDELLRRWASGKELAVWDLGEGMVVSPIVRRRLDELTSLWTGLK